MRATAGPAGQGWRGQKDMRNVFSARSIPEEREVAGGAAGPLPEKALEYFGVEGGSSMKLTYFCQARRVQGFGSIPLEWTSSMAAIAASTKRTTRRASRGETRLL